MDLIFYGFCLLAEEAPVALPNSILQWANLSATGVFIVLTVWLVTQHGPKMQKDHREEIKEINTAHDKTVIDIVEKNNAANALARKEFTEGLQSREDDHAAQRKEERDLFFARLAEERKLFYEELHSIRTSSAEIARTATQSIIALAQEVKAITQNVNKGS